MQSVFGAGGRKGFWNALKNLRIKEAWIIAPVQESYPVAKGVCVANLRDFLAKMGGSGGLGFKADG
jgi:hypothetical protein